MIYKSVKDNLSKRFCLLLENICCNIHNLTVINMLKFLSLSNEGNYNTKLFNSEIYFLTYNSKIINRQETKE